MSRSSHFLRGARASWLLTLALCGPVLADYKFSLTITGDGRVLGETPIILETRENLIPGTHLMKLGAKTAVGATVFKDQGKTYLGTVFNGVPTQGTVSLKLDDEIYPEETGKGVELIPHGQRIEVRIDGKPVTEYIPDDGPKPYFFPLIGPSGAAMTRAYPMKKVEGERIDHPHHRSLWFTHGSINKVDFWSEAKGHGRIVETSRPTVVGGLAVGTIRTTDDWLDPDGKKVCEDERVVRIYATRKGRTLDFDITLKATQGPVTFGDTKEGMFGLRVATSMDVTSKKGGKIVNAEGIENTPAWGKPSPWVDYTGPVDGKTVGVAILNHPSSFRSPTTWHVRDYGLFAANPFGWHDFGQKTSGEYVLPKGESISFRYRIILHNGDTASAELPAAFRAYEAPPKAVIE
jgi:Methane oxygenase PmoA